MAARVLAVAIELKHGKSVQYLFGRHIKCRPNNFCPQIPQNHTSRQVLLPSPTLCPLPLFPGCGRPSACDLAWRSVRFQVGGVSAAAALLRCSAQGFRGALGRFRGGAWEKGKGKKRKGAERMLGPLGGKVPATCYSPTGEPRSTLADEALHFRVRDGNGCFILSMATGKAIERFWECDVPRGGLRNRVRSV